MSWFPTGADDGGQASLGIGDGFNSQLWQVLLASDIIPGTSPGYETCKTIYSYHPLGRKMVELPLEKTFSKDRKISFNSPSIFIEDELTHRFNKEWKRLGGLGGNTIIYRIAVLSRIYGVGSLLCGTKGEDPNTPLDYDTLHRQELYFSMLDPLNTAGSLVLQQDPTASDFLQPQAIQAAGKNLDRSRTAVIIHEQPIWIQWTDASFGFIGRSIFQRSLYPLKSFILSMVADNEIQKKLMLLIAKIKSPGSVLDKRALDFFGLRRSKLKESATGNVLSIGIEEAIETLNMTNVHESGNYSRNNIVRNIAAASGMPAMLLLDERIAEGFGEGSEDAKEISIYIDTIRNQLSGAFSFIDKIVMHRAWNKDWYKSIQSKYPEYQNISYENAFFQFCDAFQTEWPALYQVSESDQLEAESKKILTALRSYEILADGMDNKNKSSLLEWVYGQIKSSKFYNQGGIDFDPDSFQENAEKIERAIIESENEKQSDSLQDEDLQPFSNKSIASPNIDKDRINDYYKQAK